MRNDLLEPAADLHLAESSRVNRRALAAEARLEPVAIDAALSDETMPMLAQRGSRRDAGGPAASSLAPQTASHSLIDALSAKLDALEEQHVQIRRLLDQAGRRRVDPATR